MEEVGNGYWLESESTQGWWQRMLVSRRSLPWKTSLTVLYEDLISKGWHYPQQKNSNYEYLQGSEYTERRVSQEIGEVVVVPWESIDFGLH